MLQNEFARFIQDCIYTIDQIKVAFEFSDRNELLSLWSVFKNNKQINLDDIIYVCHKHIHERM